MTVEKTGRKTGKLVPQKHGGALLDGAADPSRHVPGPGRPPSKVKAALREDFDTRRTLLNEIADGVVQGASVKDRIKALEVMARFSDLETGKVDTSLVEEMGAAVMAETDDELLLRRIHARWVEIIARRIAGE